MKVFSDDALLNKTFLDYERAGNGGMSYDEREAHNAVRIAARAFGLAVIQYVPASKRGDVVREIRAAQQAADKAIAQAHAQRKDA